MEITILKHSSQLANDELLPRVERSKYLILWATTARAGMIEH